MTPAVKRPSIIPTSAPVTELVYPISPDYIAHWPLDRAIAELIANAIDADAGHFSISYANGILEIIDTAANGVGAEGMILGFSDKRDRTDQIGQFGEGLKIATLVLARSSQVGEILVETVGYAFSPFIVDQAGIGGLNIPSRSAEPAKVLCWRLWSCDRTAGTRVRIEIPEAYAKAAQARFRHLSEETPYAAPTGAGLVILEGKPGRIYIGGLLVSEQPNLCCSYDLSLTGSKALQNRDRTVIDGYKLDAAIGEILSECVDAAVYERFVEQALTGSLARAEAGVFHRIDTAAKRRIMSEIGQARFGEAAVFCISDKTRQSPRYGEKPAISDAEASLDLLDRGYAEVKAPKLEPWTAKLMFVALGVPTASSLANDRSKRKAEQTDYTRDGDLTEVEKSILGQAVAYVRATWGVFAVERVRVYERIGLSGGECVEFAGFYEVANGTISIRRDQLISLGKALGVLVHEAAHRLAHRYPGMVGLNFPDYDDRSRGFEQALGVMASLAVQKFAAQMEASGSPISAAVPEREDGVARIDAEAAACGQPALPGFHYLRRNGCFRPVSESGMAAGSLFERMVTSGGRTVTRYAADNFVNAATVRSLILGMSGGRRHREMEDLVGPSGMSPAVFWLATTVPLYAYDAAQKKRASSRKFPSDLVGPAKQFCAALTARGGEWASIAGQVKAMIDNPASLDFELDWQAPLMRIVDLEAERLSVGSSRADSGTEQKAACQS